MMDFPKPIIGAIINQNGIDYTTLLDNNMAICYRNLSDRSRQERNKIINKSKKKAGIRKGNGFTACPSFIYKK
jgi:hypothetical protein